MWHQFPCVPLILILNNFLYYCLWGGKVWWLEWEMSSTCTGLRILGSQLKMPFGRYYQSFGKYSLLRKACFWGRASGTFSLAPSSVPSLPRVVSAVKDVTAQVSALTSHCHIFPAINDSPSETINQIHSFFCGLSQSRGLSQQKRELVQLAINKLLLFALISSNVFN